MQDVEHRFNVGDKVRVRRENPTGNPRTPAYVRGKIGVVAAFHGLIHNPLDHHDVYPPLYSVVFDVQQVFGSPSGDTLSVDVHEDWLDPA